MDTNKNMAEMISQCTNPKCPHCGGTGKIKISNPTVGTISEANCYGNTMVYIPETIQWEPKN